MESRCECGIEPPGFISHGVSYYIMSPYPCIGLPRGIIRVGLLKKLNILILFAYSTLSTCNVLSRILFKITENIEAIYERLIDKKAN